MELAEIYHPIERELQGVEEVLSSMFSESKRPAILELGDFLMASPGKRIRPALVILSANVCPLNGGGKFNHDELVSMAAAVELVHIASLIHDDVIDSASLRHNRPTINSKWKDDISIVFGDYVYAKAFGLISGCGNSDIFSCISEAIHVMCEGELTQVCHRNNMDLPKDSYMVIVEKKTASLFAASCHAGSIIGRHGKTVQSALKNYGMNFGVAFQIADDCRDIISEANVSGKSSGQDMSMGEMTLPMMNLLDAVAPQERVKLTEALKERDNSVSVENIRSKFLRSGAVEKTRETILHYIDCAKEGLSFIEKSDYKASLGFLADYIFEKTF